MSWKNPSKRNDRLIIKRVGSAADRIDSIQRTIEERSDRVSRRLSEWISSTSNQSDHRDHSTNHSREFPSQRTIGLIRSDQPHGLGRERRSHANSGHSRRSTSSVSEETSLDRTPSSPNLIESSSTDTNDCRTTERKKKMIFSEISSIEQRSPLLSSFR